eukprot:GEMP01015633.1.p1 GENE.GEMP01015633.1~~GEMP01015633.1.p1  ORF type:complete len:620 (+),score=162.17 GEMP01015633.1:833-2692(+)
MQRELQSKYDTSLSANEHVLEKLKVQYNCATQDANRSLLAELKEYQKHILTRTCEDAHEREHIMTEAAHLIADEFGSMKKEHDLMLRQVVEAQAETIMEHRRAQELEKKRDEFLATKRENEILKDRLAESKMLPEMMANLQMENVLLATKCEGFERDAEQSSKFQGELEVLCRPFKSLDDFSARVVDILASGDKHTRACENAIQHLLAELASLRTERNNKTALLRSGTLLKEDMEDSLAKTVESLRKTDEELEATNAERELMSKSEAALAYELGETRDALRETERHRNSFASALMDLRGEMEREADERPKVMEQEARKWDTERAILQEECAHAEEQVKRMRASASVLLGERQEMEREKDRARISLSQEQTSRQASIKLAQTLAIEKEELSSQKSILEGELANAHALVNVEIAKGETLSKVVNELTNETGAARGVGQHGQVHQYMSQAEDLAKRIAEIENKSRKELETRIEKESDATSQFQQEKNIKQQLLDREQECMELRNQNAYLEQQLQNARRDQNDVIAQYNEMSEHLFLEQSEHAASVLREAMLQEELKKNVSKTNRFSEGSTTADSMASALPLTGRFHQGLSFSTPALSNYDECRLHPAPTNRNLPYFNSDYAS